AVVAALEHDDGLPAGVGPRDLDGRLDRFGAGVEEHGLLGEVAGRDVDQRLQHGHVRLVRADDGAQMQEVVGLPLDGLDHVLGRVPDGEHADTTGEVEQVVAVDVLDHGAMGARDRHLGEPGGAACSGSVAPRGHRAAVRPGDVGDEADPAHAVAFSRVTAASARSKIARPSSICSWFTTNGGIQRITFSKVPQVSSSNRSPRQAACTALVTALPWSSSTPGARGARNSTPTIKPKPRTSAMTGSLACNARRPSINRAPIAAAFAGRFSFVSTPMVARAAANGTVLPPP